MQFVGAARILSVNSGEGGGSKFVNNDCFSLEKEVPESLAWGKGRIQVHFTIFRIRSEFLRVISIYGTGNVIQSFVKFKDQAFKTLKMNISNLMKMSA